jgi:hypothetical protein
MCNGGACKKNASKNMLRMIPRNPKGQNSILFRDCSSFFEAFAANTAKRQILGFAQLIISTFLTRKVLAADEASLREAHGVIENFRENSK